MPLMNYQQAVPYSIPAQRALASVVSHAAWWPLHGDANERLGAGAPNLSVNGTVGTLWSATWGAATPNGVDHRLVSAADDPYLTAMLRLDNIEGQELLIGFELAHDGAMSATEAVMGWGKQSNAAGRVGGWQINLQSSTQMLLSTFAGEGASAGVNSGFSGSATSGVTERVRTVISIKGVGPKRILATRLAYRDGDGYAEPGSTSPQELNLVANGGVGTYAGDTSIFSVFARQTANATFDAHLGATAGSNATVNNLWIARLSSIQHGLAEACLERMVAAPREFPSTLTE